MAMLKGVQLYHEGNQISKSDSTEENAVEILNTKDTKESDIFATLDWFDKWIGIKGEYNNSEKENIIIVNQKFQNE